MTRQPALKRINEPRGPKECLAGETPGDIAVTIDETEIVAGTVGDGGWCFLGCIVGNFFADMKRPIKPCHFVRLLPKQSWTTRLR